MVLKLWELTYSEKCRKLIKLNQKNKKITKNILGKSNSSKKITEKKFKHLLYNQ